jgi:ribose transport system permease protein
VAVAILQLVRTDLTLLGANPQLSTAIQGLILIGVVLVGSVLTLRRVRA